VRVVTDAGTAIDLGIVETAPTIGIIDYSRRVTDDFGVTTVVERGFSRRMSVRLALPFTKVDALQRQLADLRATPAQWIADDRFAWLSARGFYKDFSIDLNVPPQSYCTLTVEGLVGSEAFLDSGDEVAPEGQPSTLQVLQPVTVTDSVLVASNVPENDAPEWAAGTTYPSGARVVKAATHRVYESLIAGNVGDDPADGSGKWLDAGPTNRWAMFDQALGTTTDAAGSIAVTVSAGAVDAVALLDVVGATVRVQAAGYDRTLPAGPGTITFLDLPGTTGQVTVTIAGSGQVSVGTLLIGTVAALGLTEASPTAAITDYSRKEVDDFGAVTVVQRAWAKKMTAAALIRSDAVDLVANRIAAVRARPSLWIGQAGLDSLTIYGFFKDFSIEVRENVSKLSLSIEGLSAAAKVAPLQTSTAWPDVTDPLGTKPTDNADKTSDNTAKDTSSVGGRPVHDVLADIGFNADTIAATFLTIQGYQALLDARTLLEGQALSTKVLEERQNRIDGETAIVSDMKLLGVKSADGSTWLLNMSGLKTGDGTSLGSVLTQLGSTTSEHNQQIDFLLQNVVSETDAYSKAVLRVDQDGVIAGIALTSDGATGKVAFSANEFTIADPSQPGRKALPFDYRGGELKLDDVEVNRLSYVALVPLIGGPNNRLDPAGGFQVLPGGFIMQWGQIRANINQEQTFTVTFPMAFPNGVMSINATGFNATANNQKDLWLQNYGPPTTTQASFFIQAARPEANSLDGFDWMAFGY